MRLVLAPTKAAANDEGHNGDDDGNKGSPSHPEGVSIVDDDATVVRNRVPRLVEDGSPQRSSYTQASCSAQALEGGKGKAEAVGEEARKEGQTSEDRADEDDDVCDAREGAQVADVLEGPVAGVEEVLQLRRVRRGRVLDEDRRRLPAISDVSV